jgi:hypothetical protein
LTFAPPVITTLNNPDIDQPKGDQLILNDFVIYRRPSENADPNGRGPLASLAIFDLGNGIPTVHRERYISTRTELAKGLQVYGSINCTSSVEQHHILDNIKGYKVVIDSNFDW